MNLGEFIGLASFGLAVIGLLGRVAWTTGQLVQRFGDHLVSSEKIHTDIETRMRSVEARAPRPRR